jgi:hypothetical protein
MRPMEIRRSRLNRREPHRLGLGFRREFTGETCRWLAPAVFWRLLSDGEATTGISSTRGARGLDRLLRLLPELSGRGGWGHAGQQGALAVGQMHRSAAE